MKLFYLGADRQVCFWKCFPTTIKNELLFTFAVDKTEFCIVTINKKSVFEVSDQVKQSYRPAHVQGQATAGLKLSVNIFIQESKIRNTYKHTLHSERI